MKKGWLFPLLGIFLCLILLGEVTINSIYRVQRHGRLINYTGIVHGASQKFVKMELNDIHGDDLIVHIDDIVDSLCTGRGVYSLPLSGDADYLDELRQIEEAWRQLGRQIYAVRTSRNDQNVKQQLLQDSEDFFQTTSDTALAVESFTEQHAKCLTLLDTIMFLSVFALWVFISITNIRKILHLETTNRQLKDTAGRDILIKAYTLRYFIISTEQFMKSSAKFKYALFYVDFLDFKYINDVFGYANGDNLSKYYAALLIKDKEHDELVGRINADNSIILRHHNSRAELTKRQPAANAVIRDYMRSHLDRRALSISCGICCLEDVDEKLNLNELLDRANFARRMAKSGHELNNYCSYDESIRQHLLEEKSTENGIKEALSSRRFEVSYQPRVCMRTAETIDSEALVRWRTQRGTSRMPDQFIPTFEKNRTIPRLDQYVFEPVCVWL